MNEGTKEEDPRIARTDAENSGKRKPFVLFAGKPVLAVLLVFIRVHSWLKLDVHGSFTGLRNVS